MNHKYSILAILLVLSFIVLGCAPLGLLSEENQPAAEHSALGQPNSTNEQPQNAPVNGPPSDWPYVAGGPPAPTVFTAQPYDELSIHLQWQPVPGAERYLVERKIGQFAFEILSEVSGSETEALDFLAPQGETVTYRLHSLAGSQAGEPAEAAALLPALPVEPLVVSTLLYETAFSFDQEDISSMLSMVDDEEDEEMNEDESDFGSFDFSNLMSGMETAGVLVGPAGGVVTGASPDGLVTYSLEIPEGALMYEMELSLIAVESIEGLPFSGGMLSAVEIQPPGVEFAIPAVLHITTTYSDANDGLLSVGFAVDWETSELYLHPFADESALTSLLGKPGLASPAKGLALQVKPKIFTIKQTQTIGHSKASPGEITRQVQRGTSSPLNNQLQRAAAADMDVDLAPLTPVKTGVLAEWGSRLQLEMAGSISMGELSDSLWSFQAWLEEVAKERKKSGDPNKHAGREAEFWNLAVENIHIQVNLIADRCKDPDSQLDAGDVQTAKSIVEKLMVAKKGFWKQLADRYKAEHGSGALSGLKKKLEECMFAYRLPLTQYGEQLALEGEFCPDRPFTLPIIGAIQGDFSFTPSKANGGTVTYFGNLSAATGLPAQMQGSGTWMLLGFRSSNPKLRMCVGGTASYVGQTASYCDELPLIRTDKICPPQ